MDRAFLMILVSTVVAAELTGHPSAKRAEGTCQCAAFKDEKDATGEPLLSRTPRFVVPCTDGGKEDCKQMCLVMAQAAKDRLPKMLCNTLAGDIDAMKPAAFYKACEAPKWTYVGVSSPTPICCQNNEVIACNEVKP